MKQKKISRWIFLFCIILILGLAACATFLGSSQPVSGDVIQVEFTNGPDIRPSQDLEFWIKNTSSTCISFPYDFDLKIYHENNGGWIEVKNLFQYRSTTGQDLMLQPAGELFSKRPIDLSPDLNQLKLDTTTKFKAAIQGFLCNNKTSIIKKEIPFTVSP
jgi:hypothetical protein